MSIVDKLNELYEIKCAVQVAEIEKQKLIDSVLTPEIRQKVADIEAEFSGKNKVVNEKISALESEVKEDVKKNGETVKGNFLMAVFTKGRVSWDTKALDGYVAAHPEVEQFRKVGEPSVSIRSL